MSLRLEAELFLRRHGLLLPALLLACIIGLTVALAPPTFPDASPLLVPATDNAQRVEANLRSFRAQLVPSDRLESRQQDMLEMARRNGLVPGRIDYDLEARPDGRFAVASLRLPLQGQYVDLRRFLAAALAAEPALVLDDLSIRRDATGTGITAALTLGFLTELPPGSPQ